MEEASTPQPEHVLLDDPTTADLRAKVTDAWREFARAMADVLPTLPAGARLDLTLDPTAFGTGDAVYSATVLAGAEGALAAYAVGNASLPEGYRMDRARVADLVALGWSPPGVVPGSGEQFGLVTTADAAPTLASVLARTMRDVYGAPHPAFLVYLIHDETDIPVSIPPLGTARPEAPSGPSGTGDEGRQPGAAVVLSRDLRTATEEEDGDALREKVKTVVAGLLKTDPEQLQVDSDGDINIRAGSAMVFVRVRDNPPLVDVFSPVLTEVAPSERLFVRLSELTNRMPIGRLYCTNDTVWASIPVFGRNLQTVHLMLAIQVMVGLADELDDRLHGEFGGKRFFGEGDKAAVAQSGERTGMYL
jgi:hypothetical protein